MRNIREYYEERAAILEYDHGMSRADAEREARRRAIEQFGRAAEFFFDNREKPLAMRRNGAII